MRNTRLKPSRLFWILSLSICILFGANVVTIAANNTQSAVEGMEITIYNNNLALVKEVRNMNIASNVSTLTFSNISNLIKAETVTFKSLTDPNNVKIREQNYEYDLVDEYKLMEKFIGERITIKTQEGRNYTGYLLNSSGNIIISEGKNGTGKVYTILRSDIQSVQYPSLPSGLITRPTLSWIVQNLSTFNVHDILVTYLTTGLSWKSDYVATLSENDDFLDIIGWVTLTNGTNTTFENAKLKLMAGDVNMVNEYMLKSANSLMMYDTVAAAESRVFEEESFGDYHLYTMQYPTTIKSSQTKQVELLSAYQVPVVKSYVYTGAYDGTVSTYIKFENDEASGLGMPFPKGIVRVSKSDSSGSLEFIGEDSISHTPKDETITLRLGTAFDIKGTKTLVSTKEISKTSRTEVYKIEIRNHKDEDIQVEVIEYPSSWYNWAISNNSMSYEKVDAGTIKFIPTVKANDSVIIEYTITYNNK